MQIYFVLEVQYTNTDEIMVTCNLFLHKEFNIFIKNSVFSKCTNNIVSK